MHALQRRPPARAMHAAAQRVIFWGDAEQLQLHLGVCAQRRFQRQRLTPNATVAIARGGAVIQTYAHTLTSSFKEGRRV